MENQIKELETELAKKEAELEVIKEANDKVYDVVEIKQKEFAEIIKQATGTQFLVNISSEYITFDAENLKRDLFSISYQQPWRGEKNESKVGFNYYTTSIKEDSEFELKRLIEIGNMAKLLQDQKFLSIVKDGFNSLAKFKNENLQSTYRLEGEIREIKNKISKIKAENLASVGNIFEVLPNKERAIRSYVTLYKEQIWAKDSNREWKPNAVKILRFTNKKVEVEYTYGNGTTQKVLIPKDDILSFVQLERVVKVN